VLELWRPWTVRADGMRREFNILAIAVVPWLLSTSLPVAAQSPDTRSRGGVAGSVLDAATGSPLEGASVVLQPEVVGAFPAGPAAASPFAAAMRAAQSDHTGRYRFEGLPAGVYRIYVTRFGYRPYSVVVELRGGTAPLAIALAADPIRLEPVRSAGHARGPYEAADAFSPEVTLARLQAAERTRREYLTTDARELTHADVIESVTLGEPDVFRALQRLPGVSTRSDYTAELWTRGAPWSQTRVYFDGVPLFNPLHALGMVSGLSSSAIGAVWFHPGARSAAIGEGAAGVIDLQSRRAAGGGELNVHGDLSLISAALALDQRVHDGRAGWMLSGRHAYLDWITDVARRATGSEDVRLPYGFSEVAGGVDVWLGAETSIEASWLWERDYLTSTRTGPLTTPAQSQESQAAYAYALRADWGNTAGRVSFSTMLSRLHARHTVAASDHAARVQPDDASAWRLGQVPNSPTANGVGQSRGGAQYVGVSGTVWPEPASLAGPAWSVGYAIERHSARYHGPQVLPVPRLAQDVATVGSGAGYNSLRVGWEAHLPLGVVWGERSWNYGGRLGVRAGLRAELSEAPANTGALRLAPRLSARYTASPEFAVSAGFARVFQHTQAVAPAGVYVASLATTDVWLVAGPGVPAIRSDITTVGLETWLAPGRVVTLNAFARRATGLAASDPRPGRIYDRPAFVPGSNRASGVELSARQITGPVTGSLSYTLSRSRMRAADLEYVAGADRPHVLNITSMARVAPSLRVGAAFTAASGVPFTRTAATAEECAALPGCDPARLPWMGGPHLERAPMFASLDLLLDWSRRVGGVELGAYAQLRNALGRENATVYTGDEPGCTPVGCGDDLRSIYERGMPRLPVLGLRVRR
jgi:hypothetical protein